MVKNYLKIAWRNLWRHKSFSILNISGLAIGMASAILILLWIEDELSYERFHTKIDRLYQVWSNDEIDGTVRSMIYTPEIMAPTLKKDFPEIEGVTRVQWTRNVFSGDGQKKLLSTGAVVDPDFLTMFSFPLVQGDIGTALNDPFSIVVTRSFAKKFFNTDDVVGKVIRMGGSQNFTISGVIEELPKNSQFNFYEYFSSYKQRLDVDPEWGNFSIPTFVLLKPNTSAARVTDKIKNIVAKHTNGIQKTEEFLYPLSEVWLHGKFVNGKVSGGRIDMVRIFGVIAIFILLIACINFMNLSTARSEKRAKEVGIRKVSGALKQTLVAQFLGESILVALIAGIFAILIVNFSIPSFNQLVGKSLSLNYSSAYPWLSAIGFILFTGILAGSYPAFFLSAFKPVSVLKGSFKNFNALVTPRKVMVVMQFSFAIVLIICTIVITQQIKFAQGRNAGYEKEHLMHIFMNDDMQKNFPLIKNELINTGTAVSVAKVSSPLTSNWSSGIGLTWQGKDPSSVIQINRYAEEGDLVKTAGMKLVEGRDIDITKYLTDSTACLINESALSLMKFKNPLGQIIVDDPINWHVVGVVKNYIQESPYQPVRPMIIRGPKEFMGVILVKLNSSNELQHNLANMEKIFKRYNPAYPFEYVFTDEEYARKFSDEKLIGKLATLFAFLTIFISCLGLFGLATYMAENRIKEIGVRKVLGASITSITALLSRDFIKLVFASIVIASPLAWWFMSRWLENYDYKVSISLSTFFIAGGLALLIAMLTVSYHSIKAAVANPVKSLRSE